MNTIQASELRIGNLVWLNDGNFNRYEDFIEAIELGRVSTRNCKTIYFPIENIEPIPLTEDWLVRFGFREQLNAHKTHILFLKDIFSLAQKEDFWSAALVTVTVYPLRVKLKYVHQLQNLYFALTGTELTLTDK